MTVVHGFPRGVNRRGNQLYTLEEIKGNRRKSKKESEEIKENQEEINEKLTRNQQENEGNPKSS